MNIANLFIIVGFTFVALIIIGLVFLWLTLLMIDRNQKRHAILRNYPVLGRIRYFFEKIGPEMRQYWFNGDMRVNHFHEMIMSILLKTQNICVM